MDAPNNTRVKVPNNSATLANVESEDANEALSPNPVSGRDEADNHTNRRSKLVSCKQTLRVATLNVRTLNGVQLQSELVTNFNKQRIDLIGIQEHRIVHDQPIQYQFIQGRSLITSSAWKNVCGAAIGGVGILLGAKASRALISVRSHSDRILVANFKGNPASTVITVYSPTNTAEDKTIEAFYECLKRAIESVPAHNVQILLGDFNARIGTSDARFPYHKITNRNGTHLVDLMMEKNLVVTNTSFQKREGSDHRVVTINVRLSLRANGKTPPKKTKYDWKELSKDQNLQKQYTVKIRNRFSALQTAEETATECYQRFIDANREVTELLIPKVKKVQKAQPSEDPRVGAAREKVKATSRTYQQITSEDNRLDQEQAKKELEVAYNKVTKEMLRKKIKEVETAHINRQHGLAWKLVNDISGRRETQKGQIAGNTQQERLQNWHKHFMGLLGNPPNSDSEGNDIPPIFTDLGIKEGPFDLEEYVKAKKSLTEGKSCGEDGVTPEILKRCDLDSIILDFCNRALTNRQIPSQWSVLNIIPIPKTGDLSLGSNYRGISLSSIVAKIYNKMILNRIRPKLDPHLRPNQNGFRAGRTTVSQILALRRIIEGIKEYNLPAVMTFIDFKKAFDMIHRGQMLKILVAYGIPEKLTTAIADAYSNTKAKVIIPDGETDAFQIYSGVLQGDTLAPYLFVIVLDYALRQAIQGREEDLGFRLTRRLSSRKRAVVVTDLDFAEDIALLSEQVEQAQELLKRVEESAKQIGLEMNAKKTKCLSFNHSVQVEVTTDSGTQLEVIKDFKYLGAWIDNTEADVKSRKAAAWKACNKLTRIWKSDLSRPIKTSLLTATVESVLLYGSEAWTLTKQLKKQLDGCYTRMLRTALGIHWSQHMTNEDLYGDRPKITDKIRPRRLKFAGHCRTQEDELVSKLVLWLPTHGQRKQGRPPLTYIDTLRQETGLEVDELDTCMQNRAVWRSIGVRDHHPL
ncbi:PREDICTED: uncharacterized protein LOC107333054 [Acropora digitifera]|uniref:uncharacterized protein LOC107333054 n=1 Tax=Acropora digitifera TaxID=70779 RepID=UPI000779FDF7|nr:PREDICTED: uncharacterized protein LOC107333054 [Acropora digitifera]